MRFISQLVGVKLNDKPLDLCLTLTVNMEYFTGWFVREGGVAVDVARGVDKMAHISSNLAFLMIRMALYKVLVVDTLTISAAAGVVIRNTGTL